MRACSAVDVDDKAKMKEYYCHHCHRRIGSVLTSGALVVGGVVITRGDFECAYCGKVVRWRPSDAKLARLVGSSVGALQGG